MKAFKEELAASASPVTVQVINNEGEMRKAIEEWHRQMAVQVPSPSNEDNDVKFKDDNWLAIVEMLGDKDNLFVERGDNGEIKGALFALKEGANVTVIPIQATQQRQGTGTRLIGAVVTAYPEANIYVRPVNKKVATGFFEKIGFESMDDSNSILELVHKDKLDARLNGSGSVPEVSPMSAPENLDIASSPVKWMPFEPRRNRKITLTEINKKTGEKKTVVKGLADILIGLKAENPESSLPDIRPAGEDEFGKVEFETRKIEGPRMAEWASQSGSLSNEEFLEQSIKWTKEIAEAVSLIHQQKLAVGGYLKHGDITPWNVVIEEETKKAFLVDFGDLPVMSDKPASDIKRLPLLILDSLRARVSMKATEGTFGRGLGQRV